VVAVCQSPQEDNCQGLTKQAHCKFCYKQTNKPTNKMEEALKIILAVGFGVLYFWLLSRKKPKTAKPDAKQAPVTKVIKPLIRQKTTFAKVVQAVEDGKKQPLVTPNKEVSRNAIKNPALLTQKDKPQALTLRQEKKLREEGKRMTQDEEKEFKPNLDAEDMLNKSREKAYKLTSEKESPFAKLLKDGENVKNAVVLAEILNRKY
jgi:type IV secretory pathway VirB10-like protein